MIDGSPRAPTIPRGGRPLDPEGPLESAGPEPANASPDEGAAGPDPAGRPSTGPTGGTPGATDGTPGATDGTPGAAPGTFPGPTPGGPGGPTPGTSTGGGTGRRKREEPPGLRAQFAAVKNAVVRFLNAHIELARAEFDLIKDEVARASGLVGGAIALAILLVFFVPIGGMLFAGEWIFGSIGWGLLHGTLGMIAAAVALVLVALRVPGLGKDLLGAMLLGLLVSLVLGLALFNQLFTWIGETGALGIDAGTRPLVVGLGLFGAIGLVVGLVLGIRMHDGPKPIVIGVFAGLFAGAAVGAFLSITFGLRVGFALGVAAFWVFFALLMALRVQRSGIDVEALKARFIPQVTIDTAKESLEWAKERVPNGPQS